MPSDFVDVRRFCPDIRIELRYASKRNLFHQSIYELGARCLLRKTTAQRLNNVQKKLRLDGIGLKIWDAYRPLSAQSALWKICPDSRFVAPPSRGSMHNRGVAVDVTLVDRNGRELEMPCDFDNFSTLAKSRSKQGSATARKNRDALRDVMIDCGFVPYENEWWHFHDPEWRRYRKTNRSLRR